MLFHTLFLSFCSLTSSRQLHSATLRNRTENRKHFVETLPGQTRYQTPVAAPALLHGQIQALETPSHSLRLLLGCTSPHRKPKRKKKSNCCKSFIFVSTISPFLYFLWTIMSIFCLAGTQHFRTILKILLTFGPIN